MCGIGGYIAFDEGVVVDVRPFIKKLTERGRDSVGVSFISGSGTCTHLKSVSNQNEIINSIYPQTVSAHDTMMVNVRAIPTSVSEGKEFGVDSIQPYSTKDGTTVIHNGTIANDHEFNHEHVLRTSHHSFSKRTVSVDSVVLCNKDALESIKSGKMKGSFSAAILKSSEFGSTSLSLIKNYLPLHVMIDYENNMIWFANVKEALNEVPSAATTIIDFPPYTTIDLDVSGTFVAACKQLKYLDNLKGNLYHGVQKERAIVVCSSGLDSTTVASLAVNKYGKDNVLLLHYHYGCKAEDRESQRIVKIAEHLGTQYKFVDISTVFANMKSPILGKTGHITDGDTGIEFAHEWVPCRNLIMMSIAMGIAESEGYSTIQLGANLTEQASFPDNSLDFIEKLNALAPYSVQNNAKIRVEAPLVNLMKQEIVKLGSSIGTPYDLTWSCYHDGEKHCGTCAPCTMRKIAFEMNGLKDPVM